MSWIVTIITWICCFIFGWNMGDLIADAFRYKPSKPWKPIVCFIAGLLLPISATIEWGATSRSFNAEEYDVQYTLNTSETNGQIDSTRTFKIVKINK